MFSFDPHAYGPAFAELLVDGPLNELGPGQPNANVEPKLRRLDLQSAFESHTIVDRQMAQCCFSGLWLLYDYLDQSHQLSQQIDTVTGSYWHGIMHRREPDFSNSKYWFHRVGGHDIFQTLAGRASELVSAENAEVDAGPIASGETWDPFFFIDLCQAALDGQNVCGELCRRIAQAEWQILFDYCFRKAVGQA